MIPFGTLPGGIFLYLAIPPLIANMLSTEWQKTLADGALSERFLPRVLVSGGFCSLRVVSASVFCHAAQR
ncbi:hypothetical protein BHAP_1772 [Bifidobacterium hapali]|uniref:Uncharacterized protein n=1 Tax=Bifidobacterium hapali TaxID=1630172 RepID=A0A261FX82_9BIFI|nr:hypothetical protein BHAP_1772 [Bifidobacterium hapali]